MKIIRNVALIVFQLIFFVCMQAEIPFTQIKGVYTVMNKDKEHLSPVHGFNWWKLKVIENMYRYGNSADATIQLIKEIFFLQHDGVTFDITTLKYNPARYFTTITIGKLLDAIEQYTTSHRDEKKLTDVLSTIIQDIDKEIEPYKKQISDDFEKLKKEFTASSNELKQARKIHDSIGKQLEKTDAIELVMAYKNLTGTIESLTKSKDIAKKDRENKRNILNQLNNKPKKLVELIIASLKESNGQQYTKDTIHTILLACAYKQANNKQDFLDYFNQFTIPIATIKDTNEWLTSEYTEQDFLFIKQEIGSNNYYSFLHDSFLDDYERASFFGYALKVWDNPFAPIISSIGNAIYAPDGIAYDFPDCGETSVRNFFNIILYDMQKKSFDVSLLPNGASKNLINYYTEHPSANAVNTKKYYDDWTYVVSNLPGIRYTKRTNNNQGYDITPGLDNLIKVFDHLLFANNQEFAQSTMYKKLDFICKVASRKDFLCKWDVRNGKKEDVLNEKNNTNITLELTITTPTSELPLIWMFSLNHFILERSQTITDTSSLIRDVLLNKITTNTPYLITLLGWYSSPKRSASILIKLKQIKLENSLRYIYFMQQLSDNESKKNTLEYVLQFNLMQLPHSVIQTIIKSLPADRYYLDGIISHLARDKKFNIDSIRGYNKVIVAVIDELIFNDTMEKLAKSGPESFNKIKNELLGELKKINPQSPFQKQTLRSMFDAILHCIKADLNNASAIVNEFIKQFDALSLSKEWWLEFYFNYVFNKDNHELMRTIWSNLKQEEQMILFNLMAIKIQNDPSQAEFISNFFPNQLIQYLDSRVLVTESELAATLRVAQEFIKKTNVITPKKLFLTYLEQYKNETDYYHIKSAAERFHDNATYQWENFIKLVTEQFSSNVHAKELINKIDNEFKKETTTALQLITLLTTKIIPLMIKNTDNEALAPFFKSSIKPLIAMMLDHKEYIPLAENLILNHLKPFHTQLMQYIAKPNYWDNQIDAALLRIKLVITLLINNNINLLLTDTKETDTIIKKLLFSISKLVGEDQLSPKLLPNLLDIIKPLIENLITHKEYHALIKALITDHLESFAQDNDLESPMLTEWIKQLEKFESKEEKK